MGYIDKCFCKEYQDYLFTEFEIKIIKKNKHISRVCLVPKNFYAVAKELLSQVKVLALGIIIGWVKDLVFIPSTHLFNMARDLGFTYGCSVVAKQEGVKAFLYGNDLLAISVKRFLEPIEKSLYVAVIDPEDMRAVGIGELIIDPKDFNKLIAEGKMVIPIVKNIFDLGMLLRNEGYI